MRTEGRPDGLAFANGEIFEAGLLQLASTSTAVIRAAGGACVSRSWRNASSAGFGALQMNIHALRLVQHPSGERLRARQAKNERTKADALHHAPHANRARAGHNALPPALPITTQPRPCQPICVTLPSSIRTGTVSWPPVASLKPRESVRIRFDIVLVEIALVPLQPFAHFLRVRAAGASVELSLRHGE